MKFGFSSSAVGIVAILGVALTIGYMSYQNMAGTTLQASIIETTETEESRALLETVKRTLKTDLTYASQDAAVSVAAAGGGENCGYTGTRLWVYGDVFAPTEEEVLCTLSNATLVNMNNFVNTEKEHYEPEGVTISEYDCAGSYNPSESSSYPYATRDMAVADAFQNSLEGGLIEVEGNGEQVDRYEGDIVADIAPNQFWSIYYTLYNTIASGMFNVDVTAEVREECSNDSMTTAMKIINGVDEACENLQNEFCDYDEPDCYIKVNCTVECPSPLLDVDTSSCFNGEVPDAFTQSLCFEPQHTDGEDFESDAQAGSENAQGTTTGSYRVRIDVTDEGHKILTEDCKNCYLTWSLYVVDDIGTNCRLVDVE